MNRYLFPEEELSQSNRQWGRRKKLNNRFLLVGVYALVVGGFFKNTGNLWYNDSVYETNGAASVSRVPYFSASPKAHVMNHVNTNLAPLVCGAFSTSTPIFWRQFESEIKEAVKNATLFPEDQNNNTEFHAWIDILFQDHYQSYQVRRSAIHPPGLETALEILEIISRRIKYLRDRNLSVAPPLHILVSGGSLTAGIACGVNHVGLKEPHPMHQYTECAWPARLEHLFNQVIFHGDEVVKVSNLATGGANSEIGKTLLEYQLFPDGFQQPDIVIWSHVANDAQEANKTRAYLESIPSFVNAAHNLRVCDDHLPLVVMNEEFFGQHHDVSGAIYKASSWFGLMGISQRNVIGNKIFANFDNHDYVKNIMSISPLHVHPGMGAHIGVSWTVFYNFIAAFTDACDYARVSSSKTPISSTDVTAKGIGAYREHEYGDISTEWQRHQDRIREICSREEASKAPSNNETAATISSNQQKSPCTYAFMVNRMTSVSTSAHVNKKMSEVITSNTGWKAEGNPIKQPRAGFYAKELNAHFSLKIDVLIETKYMTIMSMKSYGDNFKDTNLEVDVRIERKGGHASAEEEEAAESSTAKYLVSGYHETRTSIHVPHKFELPGGGAEKGDTLVANFRLVSGSYFKIAGLAFCRY